LDRNESSRNLSFLDRPQPSVLIAAAKWWALSARLATRAPPSWLPSERCVPCCTSLDPCFRHSAYLPLRRNILLGQPSTRSAYLQTGHRHTCDDGVVAQLHALHRLDASLKPLIERSLGPPESYSVVDSRFKLLSTAMELGITRAEDAESLQSPKTSWPGTQTLRPRLYSRCNGESGGNGVRVSHSLISHWLRGESFAHLAVLQPREAACYRSGSAGSMVACTA